jgi:CRP/FNR family cyclic AMP-dependent transcriptional regulator
MPSSNAALSVSVLRNVPLFSGLDKSEFKRLAKIATRRHAASGEYVVRAGDQAESLIILLTGRAKVTNVNADGREVILAWLGPGEFFGEMGLIDGCPRSANVVVVESCDLLNVGKDEFYRFMQENFQVAEKLMQILVRRLREADRNIESLAMPEGEFGHFILGEFEKEVVQQAQAEQGAGGSVN